MARFRFGEYNSAQLTPQWDSKTKASNDKTGWKRGAVGIDGNFDKDGRDFMRTADPAADRFNYGPTTNQRRVDGAMRVMTNAADPGELVDYGKGAKGVDVAGNRNRPDDGVR